MRKEVLERYKQAASELGKHLRTAQYRARKPERAFIDWYVFARFGDGANTNVVDGKKDGGVDAVVKCDGTTFVIQSKYELSPKVSAVSRGEIDQFGGTAARFIDPDLEDEFKAWLETVRPELKKVYRPIRRKCLESPDKVHFIFATTKRCSTYPAEWTEVEDIQGVSSLWGLYSEGFTPPTEAIELRLDDAWQAGSVKNGFSTYVGLADVKDFLRLMDDDKNERLFAQNVRTDLRSRINRGIQKSYEKEPDIFWLGNNGIYIVCSKVTQSSNHLYKLRYPSIINGSQTLHSVAHSNVRHSCKILVRVLEMDVFGDQELLSAIIRRTNTQNAMKLVNLSAHDPRQLNIARYLDRYDIFYERREREWANERKGMLSDYIPVRVKSVAQWLSVLHPSVGFGIARSRVSELFQDAVYERIFGDFDIDLKSSCYRELAHIVWAGLFIKAVIRGMPKSRKGFARTSHLVLVRLVYDSIKSSKELRDITLDLLGQHCFGRRYVPRAVLRPINEAVDAFKSLQKSAQRRDPGLDFSNYFKSNELTNKAYKKAATRTRVKALARALVSSADDIE